MWLDQPITCKSQTRLTKRRCPPDGGSNRNELNETIGWNSLWFRAETWWKCSWPRNCDNHLKFRLSRPQSMCRESRWSEHSLRCPMGSVEFSWNASDSDCIFNSDSQFTRNGSHLKSWNLNCLIDGSQGVELDRKTNNSELNWSLLIRSFQVSRWIECRFIRLLQTGNNHQMNDVLAFYHFDVFGRLPPALRDPPVLITNSICKEDYPQLSGSWNHDELSSGIGRNSFPSFTEIPSKCLWERNCEYHFEFVLFYIL
jgi:hypothetical protein